MFQTRCMNPSRAMWYWLSILVQNGLKCATDPSKHWTGTCKYTKSMVQYPVQHNKGSSAWTTQISRLKPKNQVLRKIFHRISQWKSMEEKKRTFLSKVCDGILCENASYINWLSFLSLQSTFAHEKRYAGKFFPCS